MVIALLHAVLQQLGGMDKPVVTMATLGNSNIIDLILLLLCTSIYLMYRHLLVVRANGVKLSGIRFANNTTIEGIAGILVEGSDFSFYNCIVSDFCQVS